MIGAGSHSNHHPRSGAEAEPQAVRSAAKAAKKKRRRRELVLEEEDYELLEENTGIRRARPAAHRRIKKARETGSRGGAGNMKELQAKLFGAELEGRRCDWGRVLQAGRC